MNDRVGSVIKRSYIQTKTMRFAILFSVLAAACYPLPTPHHPDAPSVNRSRPPAVMESAGAFTIRRLTELPPIDGRDWSPIENITSGSLQSPDGRFTLTLEHSPENTGDLGRSRVYYTHAGGSRVQIDPGMALSASITRDSRWIVIIAPLEVIDVRAWRRYSLSKAFGIEPYVLVRGVSADGRRLLISRQPCPFDCQHLPNTYYEISLP
jgi:hypothetical protein